MPTLFVRPRRPNSRRRFSRQFVITSSVVDEAARATRPTPCGSCAPANRVVGKKDHGRSGAMMTLRHLMSASRPHPRD